MSQMMSYLLTHMISQTTSQTFLSQMMSQTMSQQQATNKVKVEQSPTDTQQVAGKKCWVAGPVHVRHRDTKPVKSLTPATAFLLLHDAYA